MSQQSRKHRQPEREVGWGRWRQLAASAAIVIHLVAVFAAPWSGPPPASELARVVARPLSGYMAALHLNHGYRFCAPEPGPSHLVRYELETSTGETIEGRFPDVDHHWPRLLYHRHFMVSEMIFNLVHHPLLMD